MKRPKDDATLRVEQRIDGPDHPYRDALIDTIVEKKIN